MTSNPILNVTTGGLINTVNVGTTYGYFLAGTDPGGALIAIRYNAALTREEFGTLNTTTGAFTYRGTVGDLATWSGQSTIDASTLYVLGNNAMTGNLYTLNVTTGALSPTVNLGSTFSYFLPRRGPATPDAPTSVMGTPGSGQVAVAWTAPAFNGGLAITGYQVQLATSVGGVYSNAAGCPTNSATPSCTATGLANGTTYYFKVAAINGAGTGTYSLPSSGVMPERCPASAGILPASGSTGGGTTVLLTGTEFYAGGTTVTIGGSAATGVVVINGSSLKAVAPAGAAGPATVTVTTVGGSASLVNGFTYFVSLFTDDPLQVGTTSVKAVHIIELRQRVGDLRTRFSLPAFTWTDPTLTVGTTRIFAQHILDIRAALHLVYTTASLTPPTYTNAAIGAALPLSLTDILELRAAVAAIY